MNKEKRMLIVKCLLIIFLAFIPSLFNEIKYIIEKNDFNYFFAAASALKLRPENSIHWIINSLQISFPIFLIIYLSKENVKTYGFIKTGIRDYFIAIFRLILFFLFLSIIAGMILFLIMFINHDISSYVSDIQDISIGNKVNSVPMILLSIIPLALSAFTEELCFRSYLYININKLIANKWICIFIVNITSVQNGINPEY